MVKDMSIKHAPATSTKTTKRKVPTPKPQKDLSSKTSNATPENVKKIKISIKSIEPDVLDKCDSKSDAELKKKLNDPNWKGKGKSESFEEKSIEVC
jgi:predicted flavoprotein YhiN